MATRFYLPLTGAPPMGPSGSKVMELRGLQVEGVDSRKACVPYRCVGCINVCKHTWGYRFLVHI